MVVSFYHKTGLKLFVAGCGTGLKIKMGYGTILQSMAELSKFFHMRKHYFFSSLLGHDQETICGHSLANTSAH